MGDVVAIENKTEETYRVRYNMLTTELRVLVMQLREDIYNGTSLSHTADRIDALMGQHPAEEHRMRVFEVENGATYWVAARTWSDALAVVREVVTGECWDTDIEELSINVMSDTAASEVMITLDEEGSPRRSCLELSFAAIKPVLLGCSEY